MEYHVFSKAELANGAVANGSTTFSNLQDAVDFASSGATIRLSAGEIDLESETDGRVIINKDLTILGAGQNSTFLYAEHSTAESMIGVSYAAEVTFKDFTIDGNDGGLTLGVNVFSGITFVDDSVGKIENMTIRNIGEDSAGGGSGRGVFLLDRSNVMITNSAFSGNERDDVRVAQSATATIIDSTFTAKTDLAGSTPEQTREYGVRADGSSTVTVRDSTFTGYVSTDLTQPSAAIRASGDATLFVGGVIGSTFTNNLNAILIGTALSDNVDLDLTGPIVVNSSLASAVAVRGQGNGAFTGADKITGNHPTVVFTGGDDSNIIQGGIGNDELAGGDGVDNLNGRAGGDILIGGQGADIIDTGSPNDNLVDIVRFSATTEFGDTVFNFDTNGPSGNDRVEFSGILNTNLDDGSDDNNFTFVTGNGISVVQTVDVGTGNGDVEALLLKGVGGEGVTSENLSTATAVASEFNDAFNFTDRGNGQDLLLVINDTNAGSNNFSVWQWVQNTTGSGNTAEVDANELTLVGTFAANATVTANSFDFI